MQSWVGLGLDSHPCRRDLLGRPALAQDLGARGRAVALEACGARGTGTCWSPDPLGVERDRAVSTDLLKIEREGGCPSTRAEDAPPQRAPFPRRRAPEEPCLMMR